MTDVLEKSSTRGAKTGKSRAATQGRGRPAAGNARPRAQATKTVKIRMSLDLTPEMKEEIDQLASVSGSTRADVLRRAVGLLKVVKEAQKRQQSPALIDKEGNVTARLIEF